MKSFRETAIPRATGVAGLLAAVFLFAGPGVVQAQQTPPPPERDPSSLRPVPPLRDAPAEQFAACAGITDRDARDTCIERETSKRNAATRSAEEPAKPAKRQQKPPAKTHGG